MSMDFGSLKSLSKLLDATNIDDDSDEEKSTSSFAALSPGDFGPSKKCDKKIEKEESKEIWNTEDVDYGAEFYDDNDKRLKPDYEILYRQAIGSEDSYLGMSNKTVATSSCEDLLVKIQLPNAEMKDIDLAIKKQFLSCRHS